MPDMIQVLQQITQNSVSEMGLTDLVIGTVTKIQPLEIVLETTMLPVPQNLLKLTAPVIQKTFTISTHTHQVTTGDGTYTTTPSNSAIQFYENGVALPPGIENRGLAIGDKVLMLRVLNGQNFLVLSRIY